MSMGRQRKSSPSSVKMLLAGRREISSPAVCSRGDFRRSVPCARNESSVLCHACSASGTRLCREISMPRNLRALLVSILALWHDRSQKELGAASGIPQKRVSQLLRGEEIEDEVFDRLLAAASDQPAEVAIVTACLESLAGLEQDSELTAAERAEVEMGVQELAVLSRGVLTAAVRRSRAAPALDRYPQPTDLEPARWHAGMLFQVLQGLPEDQQSAVVRVAREYQSWALVERLCEESEVQ